MTSGDLSDDTLDADVPLAYARSVRTGIDPAQLYRVIAVTGLLAGVGRLSVPLRGWLYGIGTLVSVPNLGFPGASFILSVLMTFIGTGSAALLLICSGGILAGRHRWTRWLWLSEPAYLVSLFISIATSVLGVVQRYNLPSSRAGYSYPPIGQYFLTYSFSFVSGAAYPVTMLMLLRVIAKADRGSKL